MSHRGLLIVSALVVARLVSSGNGRDRDKPRRAAPFVPNNRPHLVAQLGHSGGVTSVAIAPDGKRVLTGSGDHTARIWDTETGKELRRLAHTTLVRSVAFA